MEMVVEYRYLRKHKLCQECHAENDYKLSKKLKILKKQQRERQKEKNMVDVVDNKLVFIPLNSIGKFIFDTDVNQYYDELAVFNYEETDEFNKEYYKSQDGNLIIAVRKNILESIFCYKELYYKNTNLLGLSLSEFSKLLQTDHVGYVEEYNLGDEVSQFVYQFDEIGVQVWTKQSKVVTIIASGLESYSDEPFEG